MISMWGRPPARRMAAIAAALTLALAASACGRRGDPLPPPDASATATPTPSQADNSGFKNPGEEFTRPKVPPISPPHTPFVLDPVL